MEGCRFVFQAPVFFITMWTLPLPPFTSPRNNNACTPQSLWFFSLITLQVLIPSGFEES